MHDLISRQAAIDALDEIEAEVADGYGYQYAKWREYFVEMPSAQPERASCKQVTGKLDLINRQDAIDAIVKLTNCNTPKDLREYVAEHSLWSLWSGGVLEALEAVEALPSAPLYTLDELQIMQDLVEKIYEIREVEALQRTQLSLTKIIRCKDCKYWNNGNCNCPDIRVDCSDYYVGDIVTEEDFYCGFAERRENE